VKDLRTHFFTRDGVVQAVDGVDLTIQHNEIIGLVGESGCGKSVTALSIMRLLDHPGRIVSGEVTFDGTSILDLSEREMVDLRGSRISMIFQQPQSSLNPIFSVGEQIAEMFQIHQGMHKAAALDKAISLLCEVGIPDASTRAKSYPHQMSGGQAQRVMIAIALALNPELLIADEPTTALDVTVQAQILDLIRDLSRRINTAVLLITHELGVIAEMADRVAVMYAGRILETAHTKDLFAKSSHPYTQGLINSIPVLGKVEKRLNVIPGSVPNLVELPDGCRFAPRCQARREYDLEICNEQEPDLVLIGNGHKVRCWLHQSSEGRQVPLATDGGNES
jgi:oligopeptide/dipeptide ABC transporter ATP-binding protein